MAKIKFKNLEVINYSKRVLCVNLSLSITKAVIQLTLIVPIIIAI